LRYFQHMMTLMMRRFIYAAIAILLFSPSLRAQFTIGQGTLFEGGKSIHSPGLDTIFVVRNSNNVVLTYTHPDTTSFSWHKIRLEADGTLSRESLPSPIDVDVVKSTINVDEACGYAVEIGQSPVTTFKYAWIIDYELLVPTIDSVMVYDDYKHGMDSCREVQLQLFHRSPQVVVGDYTLNKPDTLVRYQKIEWEAQPATEIAEQVPVVVIPVPYEDTRFSATIKEHFFSSKTPVWYGDTKADTLYIPVAVKIDDIKALVNKYRDKSNELGQDESTGTQVKGSAPLDVRFSVTGASSKINYYEWRIWPYGSKEINGIAFFEDSIPYEFKRDVPDNGAEPDYYVKVTASNDYCLDTARMEVKLLISYLDAANILILDAGSGDEPRQFKVVYRSILPGTFYGTIYNRWGRRVFSWRDPEKGWDGRVNGKLVSPGVYYYLITGEGTDGEKWKLKRDLTIIRSK
jgi:hypothetical protein